MDGHDLHHVAAGSRQRAGRLLQSYGQLVGQRARRGGQPQVALGFEAIDEPDGLQHVRGSRRARRAFLLEPRHPPRTHHGIAHHGRHRARARLVTRPLEQAHGVRQPRRQSVGARCEAREAPVEIAPPHASRLRILLGGQHEEVVCRQTHHIAGQHFEQRSRVRRVRQRLHEAGDHAHLGRGREQRPARHHALEALGAQRLGIHARTAHLAQQHHHVAGSVAVLAQHGEPAGDGLGAGALRIGRAHAGAAPRGLHRQHEVDARRAAPIAGGALLVRLQRHERLAEHRRLLEHAVDERQHVAVAAEVLRELDVERAHFVGAHRLLMSLVHVHVGAAEAVDGLLRIAYRAQVRAPRPGQARDHVDLQLAGVLELVHHHQFEAAFVARGDVRAAFERVERAHEQVVVIQLARGALRTLEARGHLARERHELGGQRVRQRERDILSHARVHSLIRFDLGLHIGAAERARQVGAAVDHSCQRTRVARRGRVGQKRPERLHRVGRGRARPFGGRALPRPLERGQHALVGQQQLARERRGLRGRRPEIERVEAAAQPRRLVHQSLQHGGHRRSERHRRARRVLVEQRRVRAARDDVVVVAQRAVDGVGHGFGPLRIAHDAERRIQPQVERVGAQDARAHAVDGGYPGAVHAQRFLGQPFGAQRALDARLDLGGRLLGERDGQHLVDAGRRRAALGQKRIGDALRERERLARAGAGRHEQGTAHVLDALALTRGAG